MIRVGVIGIGVMGNTHLDVYAKRPDVKVVAISDVLPERLSGRERAAALVNGEPRGDADLRDARRHAEGLLLIDDPDVDLVDICLPTPLHADHAIAALRRGKHVLLEKPLARTHADARRIVEAAEQANTMILPAMCMRFWPGWDWLKRAVGSQEFGRVRAATFRRIGAHPGGAFYGDGDAAGGAILDLHIHDVDFVQWCFGMPRAVLSAGYSSHTTAIDHVITRYDFGPAGPLVVAEGGWSMSPGFGFAMQFTVNFERATAWFDLASPTPLMLAREGRREPVPIEKGAGYAGEIDYLLECIRTGRKPSVVTVADAARSVQIVEAEVQSIRTGGPVSLAT
jgi:predicted dehydrogenase